MLLTAKTNYLTGFLGTLMSRFSFSNSHKKAGVVQISPDISEQISPPGLPFTFVLLFDRFSCLGIHYLPQELHFRKQQNKCKKGERHAKLITDFHPCMAVWEPTPPPPTYILHPSPCSPCYICRHTTPSLLLPKQMLLKTNHSVKITVLPWQSCDDVNKLLRRDRGMTWRHSVFIVLCLYSNAWFPSRSFSPLVVLWGLETCQVAAHWQFRHYTLVMHRQICAKVGRYWQHT